MVLKKAKNWLSKAEIARNCNKDCFCSNQRE